MAMNHQQFREWLPLFAYGDLEDIDKETLQQHLETCADCRTELEKIGKLHGSLDRLPRVSVTEELLEESRQGLRAALRIKRVKPSFWNRVRESLTAAVPEYRVALGAAAMLAAGVFVGYIAFGRTQTPVVVTQTPVGQPDLERGNMEITNVRFLDSDASDGQVEFGFDAVTPMRAKGSINDAQIQKVLSYAVVNEQNPGIRLRAISALGTSRQTKGTDPEVRDALITVLKSDENPGVRKQALEVLQKFPMDEEIKQAFLHVLVHDQNAGMRVSAIKGLESEGKTDKEVLDVFKQKVHSNDIDYIRLKARDLIQEVKQNQ